MSGWYRMHRGWMDHPVFRGEPFSRRDAFQWLIQEAAFRPVEIRIGGEPVTLQRGQLSHSLRHMAGVFGWPEAKVRRFLKSTQGANIIDASTVAGQTLITICKYGIYQAVGHLPDAAPDAAVTPPPCVSDAKEEEGRKKEEGSGRASARTRRGAYVFEGRTVRLNARDFEAWAKTYHAIPDLRAELSSIDSWFDRADEGAKADWFRRTPRMLNDKHQRMLGGNPHPGSAKPGQAPPAATALAAADITARRMARFEQTERERAANNDVDPLLGGLERQGISQPGGRLKFVE